MGTGSAFGIQSNLATLLKVTEHMYFQLHYGDVARTSKRGPGYFERPEPSQDALGRRLRPFWAPEVSSEASVSPTENHKMALWGASESLRKPQEALQRPPRGLKRLPRGP